MDPALSTALSGTVELYRIFDQVQELKQDCGDLRQALGQIVVVLKYLQNLVGRLSPLGRATVQQNLQWFQTCLTEAQALVVKVQKKNFLSLSWRIGERTRYLKALRTKLHESYSQLMLILIVCQNEDIQAKTDGSPATALLHSMAEIGQVEAVKTLLGVRGVNVDVRNGGGQTLLHRAAQRGDLRLIELLLDHDAQVNAEDQERLTPLHWAARHGHLVAAQLLLTKGAQVDARSEKGWTPLHGAARQGRLHMAQLLLTHRAQVGAMMQEDYTPLHLAASEGHCEVAELLLNHGAHLDARDQYGRAPVHVAEASGKPGCQDVAAMLHRVYQHWVAHGPWPVL